MNRSKHTLAIDLLVLQPPEQSAPTVPVLRLGFDPEDHGELQYFNPGPRLYLGVDSTDAPIRYNLVDTDGHRYCRVRHDDTWISAAEKLGGFFVALTSDLSNGSSIGRVLLVRYPFGAIVRDTEVFHVPTSELAAALRDGSIFAKPVKSFTELPVPTVN